MVALLNLAVSVLVLIDSTLTSIRVAADLTDDLDIADLDDSVQAGNIMNAFKSKFPRVYKSPAEKMERDGCLLKNLKRIWTFNKANKQVKLRANHMSDYYLEELNAQTIPLPTPINTDQGTADTVSTGERRKRFFFAKPTVAPTTTTTTTAAPTTTLPPAPASKNWTALGYVTPAKYQGSCGSCWAFAATGAMEAALVRSGRPLQNLSEEQYIDCLPFQGGCSGGWDTNVYNWVVANRTIATEDNYPYMETAHTVNSTIPPCKISTVSPMQVTLTHQLLPSNDDATVKRVVGNIGPVSASFNISSVGDFYYYGGGIINASSPNFCGNVINHMVLIIGYGTDPVSGIPYWICKNSYGTTWGENGCFRISSNVPRACGLTIFTRLPTISP